MLTRRVAHTPRNRHRAKLLPRRQWLVETSDTEQEGLRSLYSELLNSVMAERRSRSASPATGTRIKAPAALAARREALIESAHQLVTQICSASLKCLLSQRVCMMRLGSL